MSVLVLGSIAFDSIETATDRRERIIGGSASFASAAASHFAPVLMVGIVGTDFPEDFLERLRSRGVDTSGVQRVPGESFFWRGRYSPDFSSRETIETRLGVFERFDPDLPASFRSPAIAFLGNIEPRLQRRVMEQLDPSTIVAMDTMNLWLDTVPDQVLDLASRVRILLVNDEEASQMTGGSDPDSCAARLAALGPRTVVVKLGSRGALLLHEGRRLAIPCCPVARVVDPTGAGDSFGGAFLGSLAAEAVIDFDAAERALHRAAALASWTVQHFEPSAILEITPHP